MKGHFFVSREWVPHKSLLLKSVQYFDLKQYKNAELNKTLKISILGIYILKYCKTQKYIYRINVQETNKINFKTFSEVYWKWTPLKDLGCLSLNFRKIDIAFFYTSTYFVSYASLVSISTFDSKFNR